MPPVSLHNPAFRGRQEHIHTITPRAAQSESSAGVEAGGRVYPTESSWDSQNLKSNRTTSRPGGSTSEVAGAFLNGLSHYVINLNQSVLCGTGDPSHQNCSSQSDPSIDHAMHSGIAVAPLSRTSSLHLSNSDIPSLGHFPANPSDSPEFDLLTSTKASASASSSNLSAGLPSLYPSGTLPAAHCLPVPVDLPFCHRRGIGNFQLPNFWNHSSVQEVRAALHEWGGLLTSGCHCFVESFFCLLLVPRCNASRPTVPPLLLPPCRGFCEVLRDKCWHDLQGVQLPLSCDSLPEEDAEQSCVLANGSTGNKARRAIPSRSSGQNGYLGLLPA
ncbi:uncharacterized protein LOC144825314 [Lissotriton helveticus]